MRSFKKIIRILVNEDGELSGAKLILLATFVLTVLWLVRDLVNSCSLGESHVILMSGLLVVGLVNRMSARGRFRLRVKDVEVETSDYHRQD